MDVEIGKWDGTTAPSLEALLRRASRIAEGTFNKSGSLDMVWLIEAADKGQAMFITPIPGPEHGIDPGAYKRELLQCLRSFFKDNGATRYAFAAEGWLKESDDEVTGEAVVIRAEDDREALTVRHKIIRPPQGKPFLGKLSKFEIDRDMYPERRLCSLLRRRVRSTSELLDDVGTVFITNVPGAPFQVLGRRAPTGELFAGSLFEREAWPNGEEMIERARREAGFYAELLVGEEAEQLILAIAAERPEVLLKLKSRRS